jgi:short-subunit dehydrogenase
MGVDAGDIPGWMWMSAASVVDTSLAALERGWPVVCVPGFRYKLIVFLLRFTPRWLIARVTGRRLRRV